MAESVRCHACGATHDVDDLFCPRCAASSTAPTVASGESPTPSTVAGDAVLRELQEALAPHIQVIRELGAGGMGTVFLGRDPALKRLIAIKVLNREFAEDESVRLRFEREAQAAAAVAHPNVVSIYQVGVLPQSLASYFVMQFVDGLTLSDAFPPGEPAAALQARRIVGEVASALAAAHAKGLVHRDIKPANIMIERESGRTVVLDFGISAILRPETAHVEPKLTAAGASIGTPTYMSPEQAIAGVVSDRSDVYSLGAVAFELLTGRPPFVEGSAWAMMAAHIKQAPPKVRELAPGTDALLADLVDRTLLKEPEKRPAASDISRALLPERQPIIEWPPPGLEAARGLAHRSVVLVLVGALLGLGYFADLLSRDSSRLATSPDEEWSALLFKTGPSAALLVLAGVVLTAALFYVARAVLAALRFRRLKYPTSTLLECLRDAHADTQDALNGYGRYALMTLVERGRLLRSRWLRAQLLLAASWAAMVSLCIAAYRLGAWGLTGKGEASAIGLLAPPALLLVGVFLLRVREWSTLGFPGLPRLAGRSRRSDSLASGSEKWLNVRAKSDLGRVPAAVPASAALALTVLALGVAVYIPVRAAARAIRVRQMVADLQRLEVVEETVFGLTGRYRPDLDITAFMVSPGVIVMVSADSTRGWRATSRHLEGGACEVRVVRPTASGPGADHASAGRPVPANISCSYGSPSP